MKRFQLLGILIASLMAAGCGSSGGGEARSSSGSSTDGKKYLLAEEPEGGQDVIKTRGSAKDGDDVVVIGRIGGQKDPWLDGLAGFRIVDPSLQACSDIPGDACPTPWDYCCESNLGASSALVTVVDGEGNIVKANAKELLDVKELQTVVVAGKAKRDEAGNLTILAKGVYIRP